MFLLLMNYGLPRCEGCEFLTDVDVHTDVPERGVVLVDYLPQRFTNLGLSAILREGEEVISDGGGRGLLSFVHQILDKGARIAWPKLA
jgi:hypothetical protein